MPDLGSVPYNMWSAQSFLDAGVDDRRQDGVKFKSLILKRKSVGGNRIERGSRRYAQKGKRVD
jgi:hypothetical protein